MLFPSNENVDAIVDGFTTSCDVPQCVGAVDGSHTPICRPKHNHTESYNHKGCLVDHRYCPGSACVFAHSSLYTKLTKGELLPQSKKYIMGLIFPSSYSVPLPIRLKLFSQSTVLTPRQDIQLQHK